MSEPKSTGRKPGFNSSSEGFVTAPPVKPTAPTSAPHFADGTPVTAENRGFEGGEWEAQHAKFQEAMINKNTCPDCGGDGAYMFADSNGEPDLQQCELCNMTGKISDETFTWYLEHKWHREHSLEDSHRSDCRMCGGKGLNKDELVKALEERDNPKVAKTEDELYDIYEDVLDSWSKTLTRFYKEAIPVVGDDLTAESEEAVEKITAEFWESYKKMIDASNELIIFNRKAREEIQNSKKNDDESFRLETYYASSEQGLEEGKAEQQRLALAGLNGRIADFGAAYDKTSLDSEEAESEEIWNLGNALAQAQDMVRVLEEAIFEDRKKVGISSIDKAQIDSMTYQQMLKKHRFAPIGDPWFRIGDPRSDYFQARMKELRDKDPDGAVKASKNIGW